MTTTRRYFLEIFIIGMILFVPACNLSPVMGPSDTAIHQAEIYAESLPDDSPEKPVAVARVERLKADRASADERAGYLSGLVNYAVPGLGGLLALGYGVVQRVRNKKNRTALTATMMAIEQFKKAGGDDAVGVLVTELSKSHDKAGVRTAIRQALAELKTPETKAA